MKKNIRLLFLFIIGWYCPLIAQSDIKDWDLVSEKDNIKIYTRKPKDTAFKEIRIEAIFNASLKQITAALDDPTNYTKWVYKCVVSRKVKKLNKLEMYYYIESDLPFPISNRDLVVHSTKWEEPTENTVYYFSTAINNVVAKRKDLVRIEEYDSFWTIKEIPEDKIKIDYQCRTNPGGSLPAWLVNLAVTTGPLKTMQQLENYLHYKTTQHGR